jgi:hypothetical protein
MVDMHTGPSPQRTGPSSERAGWFTGRTRLVTVVSIGVVVLAGAAAVSANVGILGAASDSPVGDASVTGDLAPASTQAPQVIDVYLPAAADPVASPPSTPSSTPSSTPAVDPSVQQFAVDVAGTVSVAATDTGVRLDQVLAAPGWTWTLTQRESSTLMVAFTDGVRTLEFTAAAAPDGTITAGVAEPMVIAAPAAPNGGARGDESDDDADERDDLEAEDEQYEGGEDDD